jgi:ABC-type transport system involved in cytochrome c biogenesis ATPase subunit
LKTIKTRMGGLVSAAMQLKFVKPFESITEFDEVILPSFVVLTGANGSGKTHLLRAITSGHVTVDNISTSAVSFFDSNSFQASGSNAPPDDVHRWAPLEAWNILIAQKFFERAEKAFTESFGDTPLDAIDWSAESDPTLAKYRDEISLRLPRPNLEDGSMSLFPDYRGFFRRYPGPAHLVSEPFFVNQITPAIHEGRSRFNLELSSLFTAYIRNQCRWVISQLDQGAVGPKEALLKEYVSNFPPPWIALDQVFSELREISGKDDLFNFEFTRPEKAPSFLNWQTEKFQSQLKLSNSDKIIQISSLSSGERIILTLLTMLYASRERQALPRLLLLDEVDASLHPSIVKLLLHVVQHSMLPQGCRIIMTTHSPTTVALAPEDALFEVVKGTTHQKIVKRPKSALVDSLTGEFFSLGLAGRVFNQVLRQPLTIFSEGNNRVYILRALELAGITGVEVFKGIENLTSASQLKILFQFFASIDAHPPVLFVWDCDVRQIPEGNDLTHSYRFADNDENAVCARGIENLFDADLLSEFTKRTVLPSGREIREFDSSCKRQLADKVLALSDPSIFRRFGPLVDRVRELLSGDNSSAAL